VLIVTASHLTAMQRPLSCLRYNRFNWF